MLAVNQNVGEYNTKYLDILYKSGQLNRLLPLFQETKSPSRELSETYAACYHLSKICDLNSAMCYHVADGPFARGAALFSVFNWHYSSGCNISIDPKLNLEKVRQWAFDEGLENINFFPSVVEKLSTESLIFTDYSGDIKFERLLHDWKTPTKILISIHGHFNLEETFVQLGGKIDYIYTNPCCQRDDQTLSPDFMAEHEIELLKQEEDFSILSEKREVIIYKKL